MNTGTISLRYAKALLKYVLATGNGEAVYAQVRALLRDPAAVSSVKLEKELADFVALLVRNHRTDYLKFILHSFVRLYDAQTGRQEAVLVTAIPAPDFAQIIRDRLCAGRQCTLEMEEKVDPELIGGFVLDVDGRRLDASVRTQLRSLLASLNEQNRTRVL